MLSFATMVLSQELVRWINQSLNFLIYLVFEIIKVLELPMTFCKLMLLLTSLTMASYQLYAMDEASHEEVKHDFASAWEDHFSELLNNAANDVFRQPDLKNRLRVLTNVSSLYFLDLKKFILTQFKSASREQQTLYYKSGIKFFLDKLIRELVNNGNRSLSTITRSCRSLFGSKWGRSDHGTLIALLRNIAKVSQVKLDRALNKEAKSLLNFTYCTLAPREGGWKTYTPLESSAMNFFNPESDEFIPPEGMVKKFQGKDYTTEEYEPIYSLIIKTTDKIKETIQENMPKEEKVPKIKGSKLEVPDVSSSEEIPEIKLKPREEKKKKPKPIVIPQLPSSPEVIHEEPESPRKKHERIEQESDDEWKDVPIKLPPSSPKVSHEKAEIIGEIDEEEVSHLVDDFIKYANNADRAAKATTVEGGKNLVPARNQAKESLSGLARAAKGNKAALIRILNNPKLKESIKQFYDVGGMSAFKTTTISDKEALAALKETDVLREIEEAKKIERQRAREEGRRRLEEERQDKEKELPPRRKIVIPKGLESKIPTKPPLSDK
jgi:hypothetical protein